MEKSSKYSNQEDGIAKAVERIKFNPSGLSTASFLLVEANGTVIHDYCSEPCYGHLEKAAKPGQVIGIRSLGKFCFQNPEWGEGEESKPAKGLKDFYRWLVLDSMWSDIFQWDGWDKYLSPDDLYEKGWVFPNTELDQRVVSNAYFNIRNTEKRAMFTVWERFNELGGFNNRRLQYFGMSLALSYDKKSDMVTVDGSDGHWTFAPGYMSEKAFEHAILKGQRYDPVGWSDRGQLGNSSCLMGVKSGFHPSCNFKDVERSKYLRQLRNEGLLNNVIKSGKLRVYHLGPHQEFGKPRVKPYVLFEGDEVSYEECGWCPSVFVSVPDLYEWLKTFDTPLEKPTSD